MYKGDFKDNKYDGKGEKTWPDGKRHYGSFRMNNRHGAGKEFGADGKVTRNGKWLNDYYEEGTMYL